LFLTAALFLRALLFSRCDSRFTPLLANSTNRGCQGPATFLPNRCRLTGVTSEEFPLGGPH
jgi:hypothetical protein